MRRYSKLLRVLAIIGLAVLPVVIFVTPALAIANPDSDPTVTYVKANRNLLETGDVLIYGDYLIPYASLPTVAASEAYIFRLLDSSDNELGSITPFVLMDNGYNKGVFGFYFSAADNLTWGEAYTIRISQNPIHFSTSLSWDYVIASSSYTTYSTQASNQAETTINIINAAQRLETYYYDDYVFIDSTAGGTVLSSPTGETYFRGAIYAIQAIVPDLFLVQVLTIDTTDRVWTTAQADNYTSRFDGTWVGESVNATANQFGVETNAVMGFAFILPLSIGAIIVSSMKFKKAEPGFIVASVLLILGLLMGWMAAAIFASVYQCLAIYLAYVWFYSRG